MSFSLFTSRRGMMTLNETIVLVLAVVIVLVTLGFAYKLQASFFSEKDDGSLANFEKLYASAQGFIQNTEKKSEVINYYLGKERAIAAFDTPAIHISSSEGDLYKPYACGSSACICLYNTKEWKPKDMAKRDNGVMVCRSQDFSSKNVRFFAQKGAKPQTLGEARPDGLGNFVLYKGTDQAPVFRLYIERAGTWDFYIGPIDENNPSDPALRRQKSQ